MAHHPDEYDRANWFEKRLDLIRDKQEERDEIVSRFKLNQRGGLSDKKNKEDKYAVRFTKELARQNRVRIKSQMLLMKKQNFFIRNTHF